MKYQKSTHWKCWYRTWLRFARTAVDV